MIRREPQAMNMAAAASCLREEPALLRHPPGPIAPSVNSPQNLAECLERLPLTERAHLLELAAKQSGVLLAHQIPRAHTDQNLLDPRHLVQKILSGHAQDLAPTVDAPTQHPASQLDSVQQVALSRALATPDLFLLYGGPGTGKTTWVAELIGCLVSRGDRVLLVAPSAAPINRALELLESRPGVLAHRQLGQEEVIDLLPEPAMRATLEGRKRSLCRETLPSIKLTLAKLIERHQELRCLEHVWSRLSLALQEQAASKRDVELANEQLRGLDERAAEAAREPIAAARQQHRSEISRIEQELARCAQRQELAAQRIPHLEAHWQRMEPLARARAEARWWSWSFWRALSTSSLKAQWAQLQADLAQAKSECTSCGDELRELTRNLQELEQRATELEINLLADHRSRLQSEYLRQLETAQELLAAAEAEWEQQVVAVKKCNLELRSPGVPELHQARSDWAKTLSECENELDLVRTWERMLEQDMDSICASMASHCNVVAAPLSLVAHHLRPATGNGAKKTEKTYDFLIIEDADQITESDFLCLAGIARHWVLVAEHTSESPREIGRAASNRKPPPGRHDHSQPLRPALFQRLWQSLHCDPRKLPYAWIRENGRLCCRLRPVSPDQRGWIQREPLADSPDVELRIFTPPRGRSELAEVLFPANMGLHDAKQHIYRELQELTIRAGHGSVHWDDGEDWLALNLSGGPCRKEITVELEPGLRETVGFDSLDSEESEDPSAWHTCRVEFARSQGWSRIKAEEWVSQRLGLRDLGRTARFDRIHRMEPNLASIVGEWLGCPSHANTKGTFTNGNRSVVEFFPVPSLRDERGRQRGQRPPTELSALICKLHGGAGLEVDIGDPRQRERVPSEWRSALPNRGCVNWVEAQAVVRLASTFSGIRDDLAILALYDAQAVLIRFMLASEGLQIRVESPDTMYHLEVGTAIVSLTRSHTHRAVAYGEHSRHLPLVLTRARKQLMLVGDPGTLIRRSEWDGPLENSDDASASRERCLLRRMAGLLSGRVGEQHGFLLRPGVFT